MRLLALYLPNQHHSLRTRPVARTRPGPSFSYGPRRRCHRCLSRPICCRRYRRRCCSRHYSNCREQITMSPYISCRDPPTCVVTPHVFPPSFPHTRASCCSYLIPLFLSLSITRLCSSLVNFMLCYILLRIHLFAPVSSHLVSSLHSPEDPAHILYNTTITTITTVIIICICSGYCVIVLQTDHGREDSNSQSKCCPHDVHGNPHIPIMPPINLTMLYPALCMFNLQNEEMKVSFFAKNKQTNKTNICSDAAVDCTCCMALTV